MLQLHNSAKTTEGASETDLQNFLQLVPPTDSEQVVVCCCLLYDFQLLFYTITQSCHHTNIHTRQIREELRPWLKGVHDLELERITMNSLKERLPTGLHNVYQGHKKETERWITLVRSASLSRAKVAAIREERKKKQEQLRAKQETVNKAKAFKAKMEDIAQSLRVEWKDLSSQPFTQALLVSLNKPKTDAG